MNAAPHRLSLFSQRLDRVAHVAYFLGAVIPLAALAGVVLTSDELVSRRLGAPLGIFVAATAMLSLGCFFLLRRITRRALEHMDQDASRLATLLNASTALSTAEDGPSAARVTASYAARIAQARAAFVLSKDSSGSLECLASSGTCAGELLSGRRNEIESLASFVVDEGRPAMRRPMPAPQPPSSSGQNGWAAPTTVAVPFVTGSGLAVAALIVVHGEEDGRFEPSQLDGLLTLAGLASVALANAELRRALAVERQQPCRSHPAGQAQESQLTHPRIKIAVTLDEDIPVPTGVS